MIPLDVRGVQAFGSPDDIRENIVSALARELPEVGLGPVPHDGTFVIVGSGPSLPEFVDQIRDEQELGRPVCAVKGSYDYLAQQRLVPDLYLSVEVRYRPVKHPQVGTHFLLASRCPPQMFEDLKDYRVSLFHTWDGKDPIPELHGKPLLTGGSTSGLRAVTVGYAWGFRKFVMYGFDSCLKGNTKRFSGEMTEEEKTVYVHCGGRSFKTNGAMALQAQDFRDMLCLMRDCEFTVAGDGLLAQIRREHLKLKAA